MTDEANTNRSGYLYSPPDPSDIPFSTLHVPGPTKTQRINRIIKVFRDVAIAGTVGAGIAAQAADVPVEVHTVAVSSLLVCHIISKSIDAYNAAASEQ